MADVTDRLNGVEIKVTPESIVSTVVESDDFHTVSSQIAQSAENIKIGFNGIDDNVVFDSDGLHVNHGSIDASLANITNINASNINTGLLQGDLIAANTITGDKIVADAITAREIATATITANEIAGHTITAAEIKTGTITASSGIIASIDASKITTGTLDGSDINTVNLQAQDLLVKYNGTQLINARPDINGGRIYIYNNDGGKNVTIGSSGFAASNRGGTLILHDNNAEHMVEAGISSKDTSGIINIYGDGYDYGRHGGGPALTVVGTSRQRSRLGGNSLIVGNNDIVQDGCLYNIGKMPAYTKTTTLVNNGSGNIYHGLGYYPIVSISGTVGNIIMTYNYVDDDNIRFHCYSSGGSSWSGTIYLW
jgi:hypothetical protein